MELRFPMRGVERRGSLRSTPDDRGAWPAVWAANVRTEDNLDRRLRGGSRQGLTKYTATDQGGTISDIASINLSSATGESELLFVLVDSTINTVTGGTTTVGPVATLVDSAGDTIQDVSLNDIVVGDLTAPASGFLVTGQQEVYAVGTASIVWMDPKTGQTSTLKASAGTIPLNCTFGAIYRDRLCLSGDDNAIYMSKQGDYTNWDFGAYFEDPGRAVAFQLSLSSDVGPLPTAMIPCKDSYMICGSARTLWVVNGDPTTGELKRISEHIGIIGSRAWCKFDETIIFLSEEGLFMIGANGSGLTPLTPESVPDELRAVNLSTKTVSLGWDQDRKAVHIYVRTTAAAVLTDTHWIYEIGAKAFWPMHIPNAHSPIVVAQHAGELLLAGEDGYIRKVSGDDDDGTSIESHVAIGPLRLGSANHFGRILNMHASLASGGGTVTWRVVTGDTAEDAADNVKLAIEAFQAGNSYATYVKATGTWTSGRAIMSYPRVRSIWICLWLESTAKWAYEGVVLESIPSGKWRGT